MFLEELPENNSELCKCNSNKYDLADIHQQAIDLTLLVWNKPVLTLYRDRRPQPEREPLAVIQAKKLTVITSEKKTLEGNMEEFFALMGNLDYVSFKGGEIDRYVVCWFDNKEDDFIQAARRLSGVTFPPGMAFKIDERGKKTYNPHFQGRIWKAQISACRTLVSNYTYTLCKLVKRIENA